MSSIKNKIYDGLVRKNENVQYEYERYVMEHLTEHYESRSKHWKVLFKLNWHYRVKKKTEPMLYWDRVNEATDTVNDNVANKDTNADLSKNVNTTVNTNESIDIKPDITKEESQKKQDEKILSESELLHRPEPYHFVKALLPYDIISFDIFDTLLLRPFQKPIDLFDVIGKRLNYPSVFVGYKQGRREAEREARDQLERERGIREVNIYEIYKQVQSKLGVDQESGVKTEIETEADYLFANPYMKVVFEILRSQKKTIILTSDMYIPGEIMEKLVRKCGYEGFDKIYVSCDYRCNKISGELYRRVLQDYPGKRIIHVGDNYIADVEGAKKAGIPAKHYKNVNEAGNQYRPDWMAELTGSAYSGLVNAYIHNGLKKYPFFYEYGFIYGGIYVLGFCEWMHRRAKEEKIDKIIFLSRDGDIYQKIYNKYYDDISNDYIYWSRFTNMKYLIEMNQDAFIKRVVEQKIRGPLTTELQDIFEAFNIKLDEKILRQYGLHGISKVCDENKEAIKHCICDNWNIIVKTFESERNLAIKEISTLLGNAKRIAVVDVGWTGSGPLGFKSFVNQYILPECEIRCWMAGGVGKYGSGTSVLPHYLDGTLEAYLFSPLHNKRNAQIHDTENVAVANNAVFEMFTQTQYPSYIGRNEQGGHVFDIPEIENYEMISLIHKGIIDFCELYRKTYQKDSYLFNISGFDAYRPFSKVAFNKSFFEINFRDAIYGYGLSGDQKHQCIETIGSRVDAHYAREKGKR